MLSGEYAALRRSLIDMERASREIRPGDPLGHKPLLDPQDLRFGVELPTHDTSTCLAADAAGNFVAATPSGWGGVLAGTTGIWLNSRLQSFNTWPQSPNRIMPGKRPRITLTPTLLLKAGRPVLAVSVAGGDLQEQCTLQLVMNYVDHGLRPDDSVAAPRFSTRHRIGSFGQTRPTLGNLKINPMVGRETAETLLAMGHSVILTNRARGFPCVLQRDESGEFHAAGDRQGGRHVAAH